MKLNVIEAPNFFLPGSSEPTIFLAGGITNCYDWQSSFINLLQESHESWRLHSQTLRVLNPRRPVFPDNRDKVEVEKQIAWEFAGLIEADVIVFFFPEGPSVCPIALFELGRWSVSDKPVLVCAEQGYEREQDIELQMRLVKQTGAGQVQLVDSIQYLVQLTILALGGLRL